MCPTISVIMPTYCRGNNGLLKRAIDSVLAQSYGDFEFIIIDDGSHDLTRSVIQSYQDPRIRYIRHEENCGIPARRVNEGIRVSTGKYIAFQFDDDFWLQSHLQICLENLIRLPENYAMVFTICKCINSLNGEEIFLGYDYSPENLLYDNSIGNQSVLVRKDVLNQVGGFDEEPRMRRLCDWDLWRRILKAGWQIYRIPGVTTVNFYASPNSIGLTVPLDRGYINQRMAEDRSLYLRSLITSLDVNQLVAPSVRAQAVVVKGLDRPEAYYLVFGVKHPIPNEQVLYTLGFRWEDVVVLPQEQIDRIPEGAIMAL